MMIIPSHLLATALCATLSLAATEYPSNWNVVFTNATAIPASYPFGREDFYLAKNSNPTPPSGRPLPCDILKKRDVPIKLRDNTVIYADVFIPANQTGRFPTLVNLSPYGKNTPSAMVPPGVNLVWVSGYEKFEGADPAAYTCRGYAVVNPDNRGSYYSKGRIHFWGSSVDGQDGYDVVEWAARQSWSTGKVATIGASWLAISQWFVAALNPPHLAAIVPWDGFSDFYRDNVMWGGIPDTGMTGSVAGSLVGGSTVERPDLMTESHPYMDSYWEDKRALLEQITVPAYVVADNIMPLHTKGAIEGYRGISSKDKWLRIDDTQEWNDMYNPLWQQDSLQFLDYFLKGSKNGWELTPRVRAAVTDAGGSNRLAHFNNWPAENTEYVKLYLDASRSTLSTARPSSREAKATYHGTAGNTTFVTTFSEDTQLIGYFSAHLFVEATGAGIDDMDIFLTVQKLSADGTILENLPACTADLQSGCEQAAGSTPGTQARLRVSLRALDRKKSTSYFPVQSFKNPQKLRAAEIVAIDVAFVPNAYFFHAGQKLRLIVSAQSSSGDPGLNTQNASYTIHTGGKFQSYVQIPVVPH
ncbi:Alpha/Beta hydrolase protein [Aspergillus germanicus]